MKMFFHKNQENTSYATVRLCAYEYSRLRKHFGADEECLDNDTVHLGRGTFLVKQAYGWYHIVNFGGTNWTHRILWAMDQLRKWHPIFEANRNYVIKQLIESMPPRPASHDSLRAMAATINSRAHYA